MIEVEHTSANRVLVWTIGDGTTPNLLSLRFGLELKEALGELKELIYARQKSHDNDAIPKVLVIKTHQQKRSNPIWFSGGDLKEHKDSFNQDYGFRFSKTFSESCRMMTSLPIPVIMCIHGGAIGGGAEFALASDLRFISKESYFDFKQLTVGLTTGLHGAERLREIIGIGKAASILFYERRVSSTQALELGLASEVYDSYQDLSQKVEEFASRLACIDGKVLQQQKQLLRSNYSAMTGKEKDERQANILQSVWGNDGHRQYVSDFFEKSLRPSD